MPKESRSYVTIRILTQGNYVTQDNSGICHVMPRGHLPEWREEVERAFLPRDFFTVAVHLNHAITSNRVCHKAFQGVVRLTRQVEQKPPRGREYNNLPFKMHCDSIITRSC